MFGARDANTCLALDFLNALSPDILQVGISVIYFPGRENMLGRGKQLTLDLLLDKGQASMAHSLWFRVALSPHQAKHFLFSERSQEAGILVLALTITVRTKFLDFSSPFP